MRRRFFYILILAISLISTQTLLGQVRLPGLVGDGMVLQRETPVNIWGWAKPGEKVKLSFNSQTFETITAVDGKWKIVLPKQKAGGPFEIEITASNSIKLKDILFGDVWLCSGQSNMELPMSRVAVLYGKEIENCTNPNIRLFQVPVRWNYNNPQDDISGGKWEESNPQNILKYTAVGYFFARDLYEKYKVPVGIIQCAAGGSSAESWISEESLKAFPEQYQIAKQLSDTTYLRNLLASERESQSNWFRELGKNDLGRKSTPWFNPSLDDSSCPDFQLPSSFAEAGMDFNSGAVWFRKQIDLPDNCSGKSALLELGRIVDSDSVFVNGTFVGNVTYQYPPRRYNIAPGILKAGKNNITVKVISQSGIGAFIKDKPYQLDVDRQTFDLKGTWKYKVGAKCDPCPASTFFPGKPLGLYNAMLSPTVNYTLKGMVWYQGESNTGRANEYKSVMSTLIGEWRKLWGQGELPFLFVQLPDFLESKNEPSEGDWATMRDQQLKLLSVPNTAMAVTIGLGEWNDIHPLRKKEVGQRLALAAEKLAYGDQKVVASGPIYQSMKIVGNKIELTFTNCGSGLATNDGKQLKHFAIAGADKKLVWGKAEIKGNKIIVWSDAIVKPKIVRYAWADNPAGANLCNKEGLPASPFTTEEDTFRIWGKQANP
ncbi:sialate O-acetylesterase [Aquipluma nitroreducens]|uniref:sialate O-acetylesterase n=1 Tax=Aquipluma nitroreducens TaxID=2010828 RepID=UPI00296FDE88|nr:sialate O-acetylesterase [Aquipluma nitroreducens]